MKKILIAVLAIAAVAACKNAKFTTLSGTVPADGPESVSIQIPDLGLDTLVAVKDGKFSVQLPVNPKVMGRIVAGDAQGGFIPDGSRLSVDVEPGEKMLAVGTSAKNGVQARRLALDDWMRDFSEKYNEAAVADNEEAADSLFHLYLDKMKETAKGNADNCVGFIALRSLRGQVDGSELEELITLLEPAFGENEDFQGIKKAVDAQRATAEGRMFTDFTIEEPDGAVKKLSDFVGRGKYVLVDFWASWCGPCRREIPFIKAAYEKYAGENFDVLSVAVWDKPEDTARAAKEEDLAWSQIVNAQRIPTELYGIEGIPHIILFGPDGTILKRGEAIRGEKMDEVLAGYLN